jgi:hypothetical protein
MSSSFFFLVGLKYEIGKWKREKEIGKRKTEKGGEEGGLVCLDL